MKLVLPAVKYKQSYLKALEEAKGEASSTVLNKPKEGESFEQFVKNIIDQSKGLNLPKGYVPATELWLVENEEFIGRASIRHILNKQLSETGGHIGYWIRPSKRKMGYGKAILKLALPEARKLGILKAMVSCDETNVGSRKIIEANGGILENIVENGKDNHRKMRFWITIKN